MSFVIVLIALLIERFLEAVAKVRPWGWLPCYASWLDNRFGKHKFWSSYARLAAIVIPVLIVVAIIEGLLNLYQVVWLKFIFNLIVLVYCVGPHAFYAGLHPKVEEPVSEDASDADEENQDEESQEPAEDEVKPAEEALTTVLSDTPLVDVNRLIFAALFWFVILGPIGCALYRLVSENKPGDDSAKKVASVLDWIPARLFSFTYALVGNFVAVIPTWLSKVMSSLDQNDAILQECADKALKDEPEDSDKDIQSLADRSFIVWLVVLALIVLI